MAAAGTVAAATGMTTEALARTFAPDEIVRYPHPDIVALDKRFGAKLGNTPIQRLYTGTLWAEGCAWCGTSRYLVWSDIPRAENLRYLEEDGHVARRFRAFSRHSNGNTFDYRGSADQLLPRARQRDPLRVGRHGNRARDRVRGRAL